ncbi:MAG TPA: COX15/CtaA family protein [Acidimicrobiales bacterium]|nr:COX15/CtaA family protein [Acidimicrobiales bacterium]
MSPALYRRITLVTLASLVFIMVTGAAVRLTGSGLGCSTWPSCEPDSFTPRSASDGHGMIEFVNRLITAAVMLFTLAAVIGAHRRRPRRADLFRWSLGLPAWVMANAIVGLLVVVLDLSPVSVIGHFLLSLGALWNAVVLHEKAGEPDPVVAPADAADADADGGMPPAVAAPTAARRELAVPAVRRACDLLLVAAGLALVLGTIVTGSGPHAGDQAADRLDFVVGDIARLHGIAVMLFLGLTLAVLWMVRRGDAAPAVEQRLRVLLVVLVAQAAVGYTQYFTGVPAVLVGVHVLGAALVWIAVLRVRLGLTEPVAVPLDRPVEARPVLTA